MSTATDPPVPARGTIAVRGSDVRYTGEHPSEPGAGAAVATILGPEDGSFHLSVALVELAPGARVEGHLHPFEESFYVLEGSCTVAIGDRAFSLVQGDFGLVPIASGHAWRNPSNRLARLLRVQAPQPRRTGGSGGWGVYAAPGVAVPDAGEQVVELDPRHQLVGHFDDADMPAPGSILMPGYHGANVRNVSVRMMVDELLGARHHTLFMIELKPSGAPSLSAKEHYHPFEEIYYFLSGAASGSFDGQRVGVAAGDLVFAGVGASHGLSAAGEAPVRWIEAQAPLPPASNGYFFHEDWARLEQIG